MAEKPTPRRIKIAAITLRCRAQRVVTMVAEKPKKETPAMPGMPPGGGMDY